MNGQLNKMSILCHVYTGGIVLECWLRLSITFFFLLIDKKSTDASRNYSHAGYYRSGNAENWIMTSFKHRCVLCPLCWHWRTAQATSGTGEFCRWKQAGLLYDVSGAFYTTLIGANVGDEQIPEGRQQMAAAFCSSRADSPPTPQRRRRPETLRSSLCPWLIRAHLSCHNDHETFDQYKWSSSCSLIWASLICSAGINCCPDVGPGISGSELYSTVHELLLIFTNYQ